MERVELGGVPFWSALLGASAILFYMFATWTYDTFTKQGIKGPRPLPLLGTLLPFFKRPTPEIDVENAKLYGKVYGLFNGKRPVLVVGEPDLVKEILIKEFSSFVNRTPVANLRQKPMDRMMTVICDDHWRHVRSSLSPAYSSGKLKQMLPTINDCIENLMSYIAKHAGKSIPVKDALAGYTMDVIAGTAFGLDTRSLEDPDSTFQKNAQEFLPAAFLKKPRRVFAFIASLSSPVLGKALSKLGVRMFEPGPIKYLEGVVRSALTNSSSDSQGKKNFVQLCLDELVDITKVSRDTLKKADDGSLWTTKGLTEGDIISNALVFLVAGYDTVSTFLNFFCYTMATNPDAQQKVLDEIAKHAEGGDLTYEKLKDLYYLDMCMDETLRMYPPAIRLDRICNKTTNVGGIHIAEGTSVNIPVYAMHHDPDYWEEPFAFKPERFSPEAKARLHSCVFLPFGSGPRNCIGMRLALLEAKMAIAKLLSKYTICVCTDTPKPPLKLSKAFGFMAPAEPILLSFNAR